ncbi:MAG: hypothetical protein M3272_08445 [Actinomycetota bacterium]|nr:hypothetical protein [Actinomycetota bacterium]
MSETTRTFAPGEEVASALGFEYEGCRGIESVEAVFVRHESGEEIVFLGDARKEAPDGFGVARYVARLEARINLCTASGEYRCNRLLARDRLDDDWDLADVAALDLVVRVERTLPRRLEVTTSELL